MAYPRGHPPGPSPPPSAEDKQKLWCGPNNTQQRFHNTNTPSMPLPDRYYTGEQRGTSYNGGPLLRRVDIGIGYLPAALRPTDHSTTSPQANPFHPRDPDTPPGSKGNSFTSASSDANPAKRFDEVDRFLRQDSVQSTPGQAYGGRIKDSTMEELKYGLGPVNGPPTTAHWKPDVMASNCASCKTTFTWYFRRHHCRRCGHVICSSCGTTEVPLDENAHYHPQGTMSKSCRPCFEEWKAVEAISYTNPEVEDTPEPVPESAGDPYNQFDGTEYYGRPWSTF